MTRRDYVALAAILYADRPEHREDDPNDLREAWTTWTCIVDGIAGVLSESPRFDRNIFLRACGVES